MKLISIKKLLSVLQCFFFVASYAATYTYSGSGDAGVLTNWNNTVGGGNPSNFTTANDVFNFPTGTNATFSTPITLGAVTFNLLGTANVSFSSNITMIATAAISKVIVGDNTGSATATIPSTVTISGQTSTINVAWKVNDASTLYYGTASTFYPFTGSGAPGSPTSTIVFNGTAAQTILNNTFSITYGNIELNNAAGLTGGGFQTYYNVTLTRGTITAPRSCSIKGNVYRNGTTQTGSYNLGSATTLTFSGTTAQTVDAGGLSNPNEIILNNAQGVTVNTGTLTARAKYTFTAGVLTMASGTGLTFGTSSAGVTFAGTPGAGNQIDATQATVTLSGSTGYTVPANSFVNNTVRNLTVNTSALATTATLGGSLGVSGILTLTRGTLTTSGYLSLLSTSSGTAAFAAVPAATTAIISGSVTVQRYIPARRAFRFLASPVTTASFISNNWQQATHITGSIGIVGTVDGTTGFDNTVSGSPSMFTYNSGTQNWGSIANTNATNLNAGAGYRLLIRGDRTISLSNNAATPTATTLSATGILTTGDVVFNTTSSVPLSSNINGWSLIGNPYACAVDWQNMFTTSSLVNVGGHYYIWDPNVSNSGSKGGYTVYDANTETSSGGGNINRYIQSGQAIFVQSTSTSPSITFKEAVKNTVTANNAVVVFGNEASNAIVKASLILPENSTTGKAADAALVVYGIKYSSVYKVPKFFNSVDNIYIANQGVTDAIEGRNINFTTDSIQLQTSLLASKQYILRVGINDFAGKKMEATLVDNYLKTNTSLLIGADTDIPFEITSNTASKATNRFSIIINAKTTTSIGNTNDPITFYSLVVNNISNGISVRYMAPEALKTNIKLIGINGQVLKQYSLGIVESGEFLIPSNGLSNGTYIIDVQMGNKHFQKKVIKL